MTAKHTPGPWAVEGHGSRVSGPVRNTTRITSTIADLHFALRSNEEVDANARLIAAAPDLLAVCLKIQSAASASNSEERFGENVTAILDELYAAIDKAQGAPS